MHRSTTSSLGGVIAIAIFGFLILHLGVVAAAEPGSASRTVKFADLDISKPADARVLYRRIRAAAQVVCSYYFFLTDTDKARCVRDVTADAVTKINQPALCAVYNANNGSRCRVLGPQPDAHTTQRRPCCETNMGR